MEDRISLFPIIEHDFWHAYKDQEASFWTAEEIDLTEDAKHFKNKLTDGQRRLITRVLGFFNGTDIIVARNINMNFTDECEKRGWMEAVIAYQYQTMMENIHSEAYSLMIDEIVSNPDEKTVLLRGIEEIPSIKAKAAWCERWMGKADRAEFVPDFVLKQLQELKEKSLLDAKTRAWLLEDAPTFAERLVAFVCVEQVMFSSSFAAIFWFKKLGLLPGICFANELISRDEHQHHKFGAELVKRLQTSDVLPQSITRERVLEILMSCVELEQQFVRDALPVKLAGINEDQICKYVEFVADRVLLDLGMERHYYAGQNQPTNPCPWMESISLDHKTNFFEKRVSNYQRRGVKQIENAAELNTFRLDAAF